MAEPKGKVCHYTDVPAVPVGEQGPGAALRWLIDDTHDGAPVYALRMVEMRGRVFMNGAWHDLKAGDVVFVPADVEHEYANAGDTTFKFLCGIPVARLRPGT
jgi:glyoxylate utilization-related uncharacterized protein